MYLNTFICLEENVSGYGKNKKHPSGHVTITSPGVVKCYIQDLQKIAQPYMVYLVSKKANKAIRLGATNNPEDTKQTTWKIDPSNIQGSNVAASDIDCVVVVVEGETIGKTDTVLSGYVKDKYLTTSLIENALPKKVMPKPEPKPEPKLEPKPEPKPEPKLEPKPEPKLEPKLEPKPQPKQDPAEEGEGPEAIIMPSIESKKTKQEEKGGCGFSVKDGKVENDIMDYIRNMLNNEKSQNTSKEQLEKQVLSQVEKLLDKDNIQDKLNQDFKNLKAQMDAVINMGVEELDRAEDLSKQVFEEEPEYIEPSEFEQSGEEAEYLKDIETALYSIQETMQQEMSQKKKMNHRNRN